MELRKQGVSDTNVLSAMERVPRHLFVPEAFQDQAYENIALPIGAGQTISQPQIVAEMTAALELGPRLKVLEVGTGSGYQAAVLAHLCRRLYTIERSSKLLNDAERIFRDLRLNNITTRHGDGGDGWLGQAPFERIIVTAAAPDVPPVLLDQLALDGVMILPVGETADTQQLLKCRRTEQGVDFESLWPVRFVPLVAGVDNDGE